MKTDYAGNVYLDKEDVRIGNLVYAFKTVWMVDDVCFQGERINTYKPLQLTQDLLLKFGFENGGYDFLYWHKEGLEFSGITWADEEFPEYQFLDFEVNENKSIKIQYAHQLQNLYFALTGEELIYE